MKKFGAGSLLIALAIGLVSCEQQGHKKDMDKDRGHPRRDSISQVETKTPAVVDQLQSQ